MLGPPPNLSAVHYLGDTDVEALQPTVLNITYVVFVSHFIAWHAAKNILYLLDPWGNSSYRGMCIQDSAAGPAGTMDSTAVAAAWQQSQSLLAETDQPEKKTKTLWCYDRKLME